MQQPTPTATSFSPAATAHVETLPPGFPADSARLHLPSNTQAFRALRRYLGAHAKGSSHELDSHIRPPTDEEEEGDDAEDEAAERFDPIASFGEHRVVFEGRPITVVCRAYGNPVGTNCGAVYYTALELIGEPGQTQLLKRFVEMVVASQTAPSTSRIAIYSFNCQNMHWYVECNRNKRPLSSIIMEPTLKQRVVDDIRGFLEARAWYAKFGLPYKRTLLLWGPPGSGKTSLIQAVAAHFRRNVCFMTPANPLMTDDAFKHAMQRAPQRSVLVLEDIDSLFGPDRKKTDKIPLSFSGLLNGLDGLGAAEGQIVIMTTNHPERLDPALIRAGRVDLKVEMPHASPQQKRDLFLMFYPGEEAHADAFAARVNAFERPLSMAGLQNHFIRHRLSDAATAATDIDFDSLPDGAPVSKAELLAKKQEEIEQKEKAAADTAEPAAPLKALAASKTAAVAATKSVAAEPKLDEKTAALLSAMMEFVARASRST
jgi:hypothetical protein